MPSAPLPAWWRRPSRWRSYGSGVFQVHGASGVSRFDGAAAALDHAEAEARDQALAAVLALGAEAPEVRLTTDKRMMPDALGDNDLLHATVTAEAVGRPQLAPGSLSGARAR